MAGPVAGFEICGLIACSDVYVLDTVKFALMVSFVQLCPGHTQSTCVLLVGSDGRADTCSEHRAYLF